MKQKLRVSDFMEILIVVFILFGGLVRLLSSNTSLQKILFDIPYSIIIFEGLWYVIKRSFKNEQSS